AGDTPVGRKITSSSIRQLRKQKIVFYPEDIGVDEKKADRELLSAKNFDDIVKWSKGLYKPPSAGYNE
ncbi:MAG: malonate decarboxylase subunit alpha, partial [Endomicrobia bacterium]|nr:malonate decarboxylase subunit alpha [Endomicrobiia bacterium]